MADQDTSEVDINLVGINLNRILSKLMEDHHVTLSMLHRNTGIAIPTIKRLQSDPTTNPTISTLIPIANFFGITVNQLIGHEPLPDKASGYIENKIHWLKVPLIEWDEVIDFFKSRDQIRTNKSVLVDIDVGSNPFALKVEEDDWLITHKGSILIINAELTPEHKDYAIVHKNGQAAPTLKQVLIDEGKIYLKPMNPHFQTIIFDESHRFLGVLIQIRKDIKFNKDKNSNDIERT